MNLGELRDRFRRETNDLVKPYFWSDDELVAWLNEAQEEACRRALLLVDSTSDAAVIDLSAGDIGADLHPSVIFVRRAIRGNGQALIPRVARSMDEEAPGWELAQPSTPYVFVPDWQTGYLRFYPPAKNAETIRLTVVRTPLNPMVNDEDAPEIRSQYHAYLLDWVKSRAYGKQDADSYDPKKADFHEKQFILRFGETTAIGEHWALEQYYDVGSN